MVPVSGAFLHKEASRLDRARGDVRDGDDALLIKLSDPDDRYEVRESQRNVDVVEDLICGGHVYTFTVYNDSNSPATVDIGLITFDVPVSWKVTGVLSDTLELSPHSEGVITVTVKIPCPLTAEAMYAVQAMYALQEQAGGVSTVDVEGYIDGELVGGIELQFQGEVGWPTIYLPVIMKNQ